MKERFAPDDTILVSCRSGGRAAMAINMLAAAGFTNVYNILDGMEGSRVDDPDSVFHGMRLKNGWKASGLPWTYDLDPARMALPERETGTLHAGQPRGLTSRRRAVGSTHRPPSTNEREDAWQTGIGTGSDVRDRRRDQPRADHRGDPDAVLGPRPGERPMFLARLGARARARERASPTSSPTPATPPPSSTASDTISWGKIVVGVVFLLHRRRQWRSRPAPGAEPEMPKWMAGIDAFSPGQGVRARPAARGVNPKNLLLSAGAGPASPSSGSTTTDAVVSLVVFVVVGSITIAGPVVYYLVGGDTAKTALDSTKEWLAVHNAAVMTVLFLVFGVKLIADGLPALSG